MQPLLSLTARLSWIFTRDPGKRGEEACTFIFQRVVSPREQRQRQEHGDLGSGVDQYVWGVPSFPSSGHAGREKAIPPPIARGPHEPGHKVE